MDVQGVTVRLYERAGVIQREVRLGDGTKNRKSMGHRDRALAEEQARALAQQLADLRHAGQLGPVTFGQVTALFVEHRLPLLSAERQRSVRGMLALLEAHFGRGFRLEELSQHHVDAYTVGRRSGAVKSPRHRVPGDGVRDGTIRNEIRLLGTVCRWAVGFRVNGRRLLALNPLVGLTLPRERNVRRPIATEARFQATLAVADRVDPRGRFRCMLLLARHTGRRVKAMAQLRASDVLRTREQVERALGAIGQPVTAAAHWPHGALRWRAETDKRRYESVAPLSAAAREALDAYVRACPRVADAPLFPGRRDEAHPVHKALAGYWLRRAERLAGLPRLERGAWHAFRRLWASERRHLPAHDVAAAGGWRSLAVMQTAYQHADAATVYAVLDATASVQPAPEPGAAGGAKGRKEQRKGPRGHTGDTPRTEAQA